MWAVFDKYSNQQVGPSHESLGDALHEAKCRNLTTQMWFGETECHAMHINYEIRKIEE